MGADSQKTGKSDGWEEDGFTVCPPAEYPKYPAQAASDRQTPAKIESVSDLKYPTKTAPGSNRDGEKKGTL